MERRIFNVKEIRAALTVGTGKFQSSLLIEAESDRAKFVLVKKELIGRIWPVIEQANRLYSKDARIAMSHIVLMDLQKRARHVEEGTVQCNSTLKLYQDTLEALYADEGNCMPGTSDQQD